MGTERTIDRGVIIPSADLLLKEREREIERENERKRERERK